MNPLHQWASSAVLATALISCSDAQTPPPPAAGWSIEALPDVWTIKGYTEDKDLSGIAAWDERHVLICSDELTTIQPGELDVAGRRITAAAPVSLLPGGKTEVDAEGVAVSKEDSAYFITGSHGVGKQKGDYQATRCRVLRLPVDAATGLPNGSAQTASLIPWVEKNPVLASSVRQPLQLNGFNIEGLTWKDGRLWVGVRGPNLQGDAFVIEVTVKSLFQTTDPDAKLHRLPVGAGRGVREITALKDGFLVLAGNACAEATKKNPTTMARGDDKSFHLFWWNPAASPSLRSIGELPQPSAKAEGMLVLKETEKSVDLLVIFDGAAGGGPRVYRLTKQ